MVIYCNNNGEDRCCYSSIGIFADYSGSGYAEWLHYYVIIIFNELVTVNPESIKAFIECQNNFNKSGSTLLFATKDNDTLYTSWVGDIDAHLFNQSHQISIKYIMKRNVIIN